MIDGLKKIEFNSDGFKQILMGDGVKSLVEGKAQDIAAEASSGLSEGSEGFKASAFQGGYGGGRWIGAVTSTGHESLVAESENHVLSGAVHA